MSSMGRPGLSSFPLKSPFSAQLAVFWESSLDHAGSWFLKDFTVFPSSLQQLTGVICISFILVCIGWTRDLVSTWGEMARTYFGSSLSGIKEKRFLVSKNGWSWVFRSFLNSNHQPKVMCCFALVCFSPSGGFALSSLGIWDREFRKIIQNLEVK